MVTSTYSCAKHYSFDLIISVLNFVYFLIRHFQSSKMFLTANLIRGHKLKVVVNGLNFESLN